jgi:hypothetical protein
VTYGFMDEDAAVARRQDDGHLAGRGVHGFEQDDRLTRRSFADLTGPECIAEILESDPSATSVITQFALSVLFGNGDAGELDHRPGIADEKPLRVCHAYRSK